MEKLYRKLPNGRYEVAELGYTDTLSDGIWLVQNKPYSRSVESLLWKVGDLKKPVDVVTHASLQTLSDTLTEYLMQLSEVDSEEWRDAKKILGGYLNGGVQFYNVSAHDICSLFLRKIAIELDK